MKSLVRSPRGSLWLLQFSAWVRRQQLLRAVYGLLPTRLRRKVAGSLVSQAGDGIRFQRTSAWNKIDRQSAVPSKQAPTLSSPGVNIVGYIHGQFGLAEAARLYARALIEAGIAVSLHDVDLNLPHGRDDETVREWIDETLPHDVTIVFVNPDFLQAALEKIGRSKLAGHHIIACWFWELEEIPEAWMDSLEYVDEIMVATDFIANAFRRVTKKPVLLVPLPISAVPDSNLQRADFGLEQDKFIFLTSFDFHSSIGRKNPYAVVEAFLRAFPVGDDRVRLLVKTSHGLNYPEKLQALLERAATDPRILVRDDILDRADINALQRCCDAYVSLHRAEGFGLGLAECMALGKPVIATAWSGNLDFMDRETACLVDYRLVKVKDGEYPHPAGAVWAEASIRSACEAMRQLANDPAGARQLGERARYAVRKTLSPERTAHLISERLMQLKRSRSGAV